MSDLRLAAERVCAVALETFRETARDRTAGVLVGIASLLILCSVLVTPLALGEEVRIVADIGLALASLTGLAVVTSGGGMLLAREIERHTLLPVLARPVRRAEFVVGRALGLFGTAVLAVLALATVHAATLALLTGRGWWTLLPATVLTLCEMVVVVATLCFLSAFSTPGLTAALTVALFVIGHASCNILDAASRLPAGAALVIRGLYVLLPHLDLVSARGSLLLGRTIPPLTVPYAIAYAAVYGAALLALACVIFEHKEIA
jgi:ABC-type transport system involved in multi-copper enzyme maturation permease subunit